MRPMPIKCPKCWVRELIRIEGGFRCECGYKKTWKMGKRK